MPNNLGPKVTTREISWADLAQKAWGSEFNAPDKGSYRFSNERKFDSTDKTGGGVYGITVSAGLAIQNEASERYPDMYHGVILTEDGEKIAQEP